MVSPRHDEVERTVDVGPATIFPTLADLDGVSTMGQPVEQQLEAVCFDTAELDLARHGITLCRRTGGDDPGWHLEPSPGEDTLAEVHQPVGEATGTVPQGLLGAVRALVRDRPLAPVARVSTRRLLHTLRDQESVELARVCDDQVHVERLHGPARAQDWREWQLELVHGDRSLLEAVGERLLATGATPAVAASRLARCLGDGAPPVPTPPSRRAGSKSRQGRSRKKLARGSAAQVVGAHLGGCTLDLQRQDRRLRADEPGSVHQLRIAARRLRSALTTYRPLFAPGATDAVGEELRWLGQSLAEARDAQVLGEHLHALVASEPPELVLGPVLTRIDDELRAAGRAGREQALRALDSPRYFRLLDALDELVLSAPLTPHADAPARKVLPRLLQRDTKRLRRSVRTVAGSVGPQEHDDALHDARKKAKRLRYAAESARPVFGKRAKALAAAAKQVQQALGRHQDTVVARGVLRESGVRAHLDGENGFTFGRLHALEQALADRAERDFESAWQAFPPAKNLSRWSRT